MKYHIDTIPVWDAMKLDGECLLCALERAADNYAKAPLGKLTRNGQNALQEMQKQSQALSDMAGTCIMCETIRENMERYLHTFFHLYKNDTEFRNHFDASMGVCLPHTADLVRVATEELSAKEAAEFIRTLMRLEEKNMDRMQEDISWFIKKFDYRYENESWKNSKDAVERTVNKVRGWCVGKEPAADA